MFAPLVLGLALQASPVVTPPAPPSQWQTVEADFIARNVRFGTGDTLPEVRIHYATLGRAHRNAHGDIDNAVMLLHGTGGSGH
jgi:homoserine O-acetyltransferase